MDRNPEQEAPLAGTELIERGHARRSAIMTFLREHQAAFGWAPTISEIGAAVGLGSPNATRGHLMRLASDGFITLHPAKARAISLTDPAPDGWSRTS